MKRCLTTRLRFTFAILCFFALAGSAAMADEVPSCVAGSRQNGVSSTPRAVVSLGVPHAADGSSLGVESLAQSRGMLFAATQGGLFQSSDAGCTWQRASLPQDSAQGVTTVGDDVFAAVGGIVYRAQWTAAGIVWNDEHVPPLAVTVGSPGLHTMKLMRNAGVLYVRERVGSLSRALHRREAPGRWSTIPERYLRSIISADDGIVSISVASSASPTNTLFALDDASRTWKPNPVRINGDGRVTAFAAVGGSLFAGTDNSTVFVLRPNASSWEKMRGDRLVGTVRIIWSDAAYPEVLAVGTDEGLFFSTNTGDSFTSVALKAGSGSQRVSFIQHPYPGAFRVGSEAGLFYVVDNLPRATWRRAIESAWSWYLASRSNPLFYPVFALADFVVLYLVGCAALVLLAWRRGSRVFSKNWLTSLASKPLTIVPGLGTWALFLGYGKRLRRLTDVQTASRRYFGLPAVARDGMVVPPDADGDSVQRCIFSGLGPQRIAIVTGAGGAGKSTLLGRLAVLALSGDVPRELRGFRPLLIPASSYDTDLRQAVVTTLRDRDGVAVDENILTAQLQAGGFLILFDGISELKDSDEALRSILRFAQSADYERCRFVLAGRTVSDVPPDVEVIELQPLTAESIAMLLPRFGLDPARAARVRKQLDSFGAQPIVPLLFIMAVEQSESSEVSETRAGLYERYFRRLLRVPDPRQNMQWSGWRMILELMAKWFFLDADVRGKGLPHEALIDRMESDAAWPKGESLAGRAERLYGLQLKSSRDVLLQCQVQVSWRGTGVGGSLTTRSKNISPRVGSPRASLTASPFRFPPTGPRPPNGPRDSTACASSARRWEWKRSLRTRSG